MRLLKTIHVARRALAKNKLRGGLTILGVVIGIAAVTTMASIGQSMWGLVESQLQGLGTNVLVVFPGSSRSGGARQAIVTTLTADDAQAIMDECPGILAASPLSMAGGQIIYGNANWSPRDMVGVGADYLTVRNWPIRHGGFFTERDISSAAKVCVIGQTIVAKLFQTSNPLGETIRIKNTPFRVIGVLEKKGANLVGEDQDNVVLLPYTTVQKRLQGSTFRNVNAIIASARSMKQMDEAADQVRQLLAERHHIAPDEPVDFEVTTTAEIATIMGIITGAITVLLIFIAAISLIVGGVGIMNIMLVSVTERTREIGVRMALGARARDILRQFLMESVLLSTVGGLFGLLLGVGASVGITMLINAFTTGAKWPIAVSFPAAGVALAVSALVGIVCGYYPAWRASRLDPIEALRYE